MLWLTGHLCIFCNAGEALVKQIRHNIGGHGAYLLGMTAPRYLWFYFPVALTMKLSVPLLAVPLLVALFRWRALVNWVTLVVAVLLVFTLNCHVQIGVRLVLPLIALLAVGSAAALTRAIGEEGGWRRGLLTGSAVLGVCWTGFAAAAVWPHWLCYTNELWGGTATGYLCLSDSNYDWGQGVPELARWQEEHPESPLDVLYIGTDPLLGRLPVRCLNPHALRCQNAEEVRALLRGHYVAAGTTILYGSYGITAPGTPVGRLVAYLRPCAPIARTSTFLIYDFTHE
jgi:hypothetical protein